MSKKVRSILNPIQPKCCPPVVGVLGHASCQVVLSVLSILEASAAFILLDPRLPTLRLMAMLDQATVSFVINTTDQVLINANISGRPSIQILSLSELRSLPECDEIRNQVSKGDGVGGGTSHPHLPFSHLIFTSGSTGRPMIVKGSEEGLINRARWMRDAKLIDRQSIIAMKTSVSFVDAITELFLPLLVPCSAVCLDPSLVLSPSSLSKILETHSITHYISTPSLLKLWDDTDDSVQSLKSLKVLTSSGEPLSWPLARKLRRVLPAGCKILNIYGSAEVSADCSVFELPSDPEDQWMGHAFVPVGRPLSNCQVRIRNSFQGEGEVMVSGLCLSHGYLEDENMESQRFVVLDPGRPSFCRWFASGDLGKIDSQGNLHIIGRLDNTFKVHGARVSLEEVESCLG